MPLFDNLFKAPGTPQGGLFAPDSKFRRLGGGTPAAAPAAGPPADLPQTAKKRKSAGLGEGVRKSQKVGAAEPARHGGQAPEAQGKRVKRAVKAAAAAAGHSEAQAPAVRPSVASSSPHQHAGSPPDTSAAAYTQPASGKQARSAAKAPPNGGILGEAAAAGGPAAQRGAADPLPRKRRKTAAAAAPPPRAGAGAAAAEVGGAAPVRPRAAGLDGRAANAGAGLAAAPLGHAAPDEGDEPGVGGDADEDEGTGRAEAAVAEPERTPRRTPQQEAERLARTVFVGNLAPSIKPKRVRHALARCVLAPLPCLLPPGAARDAGLPGCAGSRMDCGVGVRQPQAVHAPLWSWQAQRRPTGPLQCKCHSCCATGWRQARSLARTATWSAWETCCAAQAVSRSARRRARMLPGAPDPARSQGRQTLRFQRRQTLRCQARQTLRAAQVRRGGVGAPALGARQAGREDAAARRHPDRQCGGRPRHRACVRRFCRRGRRRGRARAQHDGGAPRVRQPMLPSLRAPPGCRAGLGVWL